MAQWVAHRTPDPEVLVQVLAGIICVVFFYSWCSTVPLSTQELACVAGAQMGGREKVKLERGVRGERGLRGEREARSLGSGRERLQRRYCFLRFLRPPDERKNPYLFRIN